MVKIVGKDPEAVHRVTCKKCASILEYTLSEVTYSYTTDYGGGTDAYNFIICPVCNPNREEARTYGVYGKVEVKGR